MQAHEALELAITGIRDELKCATEAVGDTEHSQEYDEGYVQALEDTIENLETLQRSI